MVVNAQESQTVLDLVIQCSGDLKQVFEFAVINNISLTESISIESAYKVPDLKNEDIVKELNGHSIATKNASHSIKIKPELLNDENDQNSVHSITNQSLLDIAIQCTGDLINVFEFAQKNRLSLTTRIYPGTQLGFKNINQNRANLKALNGQLIATKWSNTQNTQPTVNDWLLPQVFPLSF